MKTVAIVQARMGSSRLPGKSLKVLGNQPFLGHVLTRLGKAKRIDQSVVATTELAEDNPIEKYATSFLLQAIYLHLSGIDFRWHDVIQLILGDPIASFDDRCLA